MMNLTEREVAAEIAIRETNALNRTSLQDLANLYIVRDHLFGNGQSYDMAYSQAQAPREAEEYAGSYGDSDFLQAISGRDVASLWRIMDELMDTLQAVNAKVYNSVMGKIRRI